jgi:outer membrane protein TolC
MKSLLLGILSAGLFILLLAGCKGVQQPSERQARENLSSVSRQYRPEGWRPAAPNLGSDTTLSGFLSYALLNAPRVEAAFFDWAASVENITVERSLPDPRLTFQMYIAGVVTSVMPGLMQEFPGPGKLALRAKVASAMSQVRYFDFENAVLQTAFALKRAYYRLWFLNEKIKINRQMLNLLADLEQSARGQNAVGKATLQDVYRAQIEEDRLSNDIANLEDSRHPLRAEFKAALGLTREQPDPPEPAQFETTTVEIPPEQLLAVAFARNPQLKEMEAQVRQAQASLDLAYKAKVPDFSLGMSADALASPTLYWPQASMSLPLWRDKIAAQIAGAQAGQRAAQARLTSAQIMLTADFAVKSYDYREITRNLSLLQDKLIPKARKSLEIARAGYLAGQIDFFNLIDAERTLLNFQLEEVEARTRREIVLADLSLSIAGMAPEGSPILPPSSSDAAPSSTTPGRLAH